MSKYNWEEIRLLNTALEGIEAIEKLTGEKPAIGMVITEQQARKKWNDTLEMHRLFYELPLQERLYESGMSTRPKKAKK